MTELEFLNKIRSINGKVYVVGGWIRDTILHKTPKDKDYVVTGVSIEDFENIFEQPHKVGKSFPVYHVNIDGNNCEVSFARQERKTGVGYKGFDTTYQDVTIEQDLFRRDTTMNSIAAELPSYNLIDPYGGCKDIEDKIIRATSDHFKDDPVRALRAARQAAELGFTIDEATISLMNQCKEELKCEPKERLINELEKALLTDVPSVFFRELLKADLLDIAYPHVYALVGQTQPPQYHPEGDAFQHTMQILDEVSRLNKRIEVRFSALVHDIGKGLTPKEELPKHRCHVSNGLMLLKKFNVPVRWLKCAEIVIEEHMRIPNVKRSIKIVDFLMKLSKNPIDINGFCDIILVDSGKLPDCLVNAQKYIQAIKSVDGHNAPQELKGKEIGQWVRQERIKAYVKERNSHV